MKVLVCGATGAQGRPIVRALLGKGFGVRILTRNKTRSAPGTPGVETFEGDLAEPASLEGPCRGIDALLLLLPVGFDLARGFAMGRNAIDAAMRGGARRVVYNASGPIPPAPSGSATADIKLEVARYLRAQPIASIILQPTIYLDNFLQPWATPSVMRGKLSYPIPASFDVAWLSWEDNAAFSAAALSHPELAGRTLVIGGEERSGPALAAALGRHLGREVGFASTPLGEFEAAIDGLLGAPCGRELAAWYRWVAIQPRSPYAGSGEAIRALGVVPEGIEGWMRRAMSKTVYGIYDQQALNLQYSPRAPIGEERFQACLREYAVQSEEARKRLPAKLGLAFGPSADETLDFFPAGPNAPVVVFFHGGYWRMLSKNEFSYPALALVPAGVAYASVNYALSPAAPLDEIVRQCRAAVAWVHRNAAGLGIDPHRVVVAGHSAGGHLGAMVLTGETASLVSGALLVSGLYDLEPVRLSVAQEWLKLSPDDVAQLSPLRLPPGGRAPLVVSYGGSESAEFKRQTDEFAAYWRASGRGTESVPGEGFNHFDIALELGRAESPLTRALLRLAGAATSPAWDL